jgi:hypothetical protein
MHSHVRYKSDGMLIMAHLRFSMVWTPVPSHQCFLISYIFYESSTPIFGAPMVTVKKGSLNRAIQG